MVDEKHESKRNCRPRQKWLPVAAILLLIFLAVGFSVQYISFVSQTIYQESTSHLEEVLHKSNNMLKEMVRKNLTYLHLYNGFLENTSDEGEIQAYVEKAQQDTGFADFYFLTYDGNYMTVTGETGYLGLQTNLDEKLSDGKDIVMNTALPGKPQMLVFVCPETQGSYRGFAMSLTVEDFGRDFILTLKGKMNHRVTLGKDARGNLTRIDNALNAMPDRLQNVRNTLDALTAQMETAKAELGKPFLQEDELRTKSARLAELNAELNIDDRTPMEQMAEDAPAVQSAKAERPSVLAKLKAPLSQPCAEDKIRHRNKEER